MMLVEPHNRSSGRQRPFVFLHVVAAKANWPEVAQHMGTAGGDWLDVVHAGRGASAYPAAVVPVREFLRELFIGERQDLHVLHAGASFGGVHLSAHAVGGIGRILLDLLLSQLRAVRGAVDPLVIAVRLRLLVRAVVVALPIWVRQFVGRCLVAYVRTVLRVVLRAAELATRNALGIKTVLTGSAPVERSQRLLMSASATSFHIHDVHDVRAVA